MDSNKFFGQSKPEIDLIVRVFSIYLQFFKALVRFSVSGQADLFRLHSVFFVW